MAMDISEKFEARDYQIALFEKAVTENTIIYLPTGSGKTFIAAKLASKLSASIKGSYSSGSKRTIFIVNTVPLVKQQSEYLSRHTGFKSKGFSGDNNVDYWTKEHWINEIEDTPILVMIAQIFLDIINHGVMSLDRVNLIVFDECHRAVSDHPMRQIMQRFEECDVDHRPRVLGLSATLLNSNVDLNTVKDTIQSLEVTFHAKIASIESLAIVAQFSTNPKENCVLYEPFEESVCYNKVKEIIEDINEILKVVKISQPSDNNPSTPIFKTKPKSERLANTLTDIVENFQLTGMFGASKAVLLHMIQVGHIKNTIPERQTVFVLEHILTKLMVLRKLFDIEMQGLSLRDQIYRFSSDKVLKLITVLKQFNDKKNPDQNFCCIIFVQRRFSAQVLYHVLKSLHDAVDEYKFLLPEYMIGNNRDPYKTSKETQCTAKWKQNVLQRFRDGTSNCIVATDVVDEGVDIPQCTLIVRFDLPNDFRAYLQSKGRARHSSSQYTMLVSKDDDKFEKKYMRFQLTEKYLQEMLIGQTDLRTTPNVQDIEKELYQYKIEPFMHYNAEGKPCVISEQSAVSLLNRYCANLHKSKSVSLTPTWILHRKEKDKKEMYQVSLKLPVVSPLKGTIFGDCMESIEDAKRSVAMKTCIKLKQIGELNDNLIPFVPNDAQANVNHLFGNWKEGEITDSFARGIYSKN